MMFKLFKDFRVLFLFILSSCILSLMLIGCEKHNLSGSGRALTGDDGTTDAESGNTDTADQSTIDDDEDEENTSDDDNYDDDDENTNNSKNTSKDKSKNTEIDADDDGGIEEETYTVDNLKLESGSITVNRVEKDCLSGKCTAKLSLSLYSIGDKILSNDVVEKSKTTVTLAKSGVSGDLSHLCPKVPRKDVVFNMSILYGGVTLSASNRSILVGGRADDTNLMIGVADKDDGYFFHTIDTIIATISCPNVQKISIQNLCEDTNLDDAVLRRCWTTEGKDSSCPYKNVYTKGQYPVKCR